MFYWIRKSRICVSLDYKKTKFWRVERLKRYGVLKGLRGSWKNEVECSWTGWVAYAT